MTEVKGRGEKRRCFALCVHSDLCNANNYQGFNHHITQTHFPQEKKTTTLIYFQMALIIPRGYLEGSLNIHYREQHFEQLTGF